ncbi:MAG: AAA family ATPase [Dethiobacteria bacterium]|jgi:cell division protease FtsH
MLLEIATGVVVAVLIGLLWQGINIFPFLFLAGLLVLLYRVVDIKNPNRIFKTVSKKDKKSKIKIDFSQIGGQETAKKELLEALEFIKNPEKIKSMGIRPLKGIMLVGPPGTGKTLLAKAAAGYTNSVFTSVAGSEFIEMYAGVGAQRVRQMFEQTRNKSRKENKNNAVLFIDEIEILGGQRGSHSSHHEYDQTLNQLLVEMDGLNLDDDVNILVIGATNRPEALDEALLRPGRFDRIVQVDLPDKEGRLQILKLHTKNKPLAPDVDLEVCARETFGFSGAQLESLTNEAAILSMREGKKVIEQAYFLEAIDKVMMGEKTERKPDSAERWRIAVHETGHALVSEYIRPQSVSIVTTTPRGKALGYMRQKPEKDSYLYTADYLEGQISILLGGAVSEKLLLGNNSTGAANDFQQAVKLAKKLIASGLSSLGIVSMDDLPRSTLHKTIQKIIGEKENNVKKILSENLDIIRAVAQKLFQEEKISGDFLRRKIREKERLIS